MMNSLSPSSAQSDNADFYGIPKFFSDRMKEPEPEQKTNDASVEHIGEVAPFETHYTLQELQFIVFAKEFFRPAPNEESLVSLGSSVKKQEMFNQWMEKRCPEKKFEPSDLNIDTIISSIWKKSRYNVLQTLSERGAHQSIADENSWQCKAEAQEIVSLSYHNKERVFTPRQANSLFKTTIHPKL